MADNIKKRLTETSPVEKAEEERDEALRRYENAKDGGDTSFFKELGSKGSLAKIAGAGIAAAAGNTDLAYGLLYHGAASAQNASVSKKSKAALAMAQAGEDYSDATTEVITAQETQIANNIKLMEQSEGNFLRVMLKSGISNNEISEMLGIFNKDIDWGLAYKTPAELAAENDIIKTLLSEIEVDQSTSNKANTWGIILKMKFPSMSQKEIYAMSNAMAQGGYTFEEVVGQDTMRFYPDSVTDARIIYEKTGDVIATIDALHPMPTDADKDDELVSLTKELREVMLDTGMLPLQAIETVKDKTLQAKMTNRLSEMGLPSDQEEFDILAEYLADGTERMLEHNAHLDAIGSTAERLDKNWVRDFAFSTVSAAKEARHLYVQQGLASRVKETQAMMKDKGFTVGTPEYKYAANQAANQAVRELGTTATATELHARKLEIIKESGQNLTEGFGGDITTTGGYNELPAVRKAKAEAVAEGFPSVRAEQVEWVKDIVLEDLSAYGITEYSLVNEGERIIQMAEAMAKEAGTLPAGASLFGYVQKILRDMQISEKD